MKTTFNRLSAPALLKTCALVAGIGMASMQAHAAGDGALYAKPPTANEAAVRLVNVGNSEVNATVGATNLAPVSPGSGGAFEKVQKGDYTAKVGSQSASVKLDGAQYYSLVSTTSGAPQLVKDGPSTNKQKAVIRLQNLSDKPVALKTNSGKDVIATVQPKSSGEFAANPAKAQLALYEGDKKVKDLPEVALERGSATVLFVTGSGGNLAPLWVKQPASE